MLPFTTEQFLDVFESYNRSVWPAQIVLLFAALTCVVLAICQSRFSDRLIGIGLAMFWLWMGVAYHLLHFAEINPAAYVFGGVMIVQGILFLREGVIQSRLSFRAGWNVQGIAGGLLILYGLVVYPSLGYLLGHVYPRSPTFGVPCPTTMFTLALLLWAKQPIPRYLLAIPLLWVLIGSSAALLLGMGEDLGLMAAGVVAGTMLGRRDSKRDEEGLARHAPSSIRDEG